MTSQLNKLIEISEVLERHNPMSPYYWKSLFDELQG